MKIRQLFGIWVLAVNLTGEQPESIHFSYCAMLGAGIKRRIESVCTRLTLMSDK